MIKEFAFLQCLADAAGQAESTMQRKRSRHPPPPLDVTREFLDPSLDPAGDTEALDRFVDDWTPVISYS